MARPNFVYFGHFRRHAGKRFLTGASKGKLGGLSGLPGLPWPPAQYHYLFELDRRPLWVE